MSAAVSQPSIPGLPELPPLPPLPKLPPDPGPTPPVLPELLRDALAGEWARELILQASISSPRSIQAALGPSEIGQLCQRRIAYRLAGATYVNIAPALKALVGTGFHAVIADSIERLHRDTGRFLVEHRVSYRHVAGTVDLFDRYKHRLIDWKTSTPQKIGRYRREGLPINYRVQVAIYAEALRAAGERVQECVLVFVPREGELDQVSAFASSPDKALADEYIDRYQEINDRLSQGETPGSIEPKPGPLCRYCPNYQPTASNLDVACPGEGDSA